MKRWPGVAKGVRRAVLPAAVLPAAVLLAAALLPALLPPALLPLGPLPPALLPAVGVRFFFSPWGKFPGQAAAQTVSAAVQDEPAVPVRVAAVVRGELGASLEQTATLASAASTAVFAALAGIVAKVEVEEGSPVKKGGVLLRLASRELELELERARINLEREKAEWERRKTIAEQALNDRREFREARFAFELKKIALEQLTNERERQETEAARTEESFASQLASRKELDDARYQSAQARFQEARARVEFTRAREDWERVRSLDARSLIDQDAYLGAKFAHQQAAAEYNLARLKKSQAVVRAPQQGVVVSLEVQAGDYVTPATRLATLANLTALEAVVYLPEANWGAVRPGLPVELSPLALPGVSVGGAVIRKSPTIDPKTGTFKVTIALQGGESAKVRPGMFGTLRIRLDGKAGALLVPRQAVIGEGVERYLYIVEDGRAARRRVTTGAAQGEQVEIMAGLAGTERVVTVGQFGLKPGARVRVMSGGGELSGP